MMMMMMTIFPTSQKAHCTFNTHNSLLVLSTKIKLSSLQVFKYVLFFGGGGGGVTTNTGDV